jgi:septum formation protein
MKVLDKENLPRLEKPAAARTAAPGRRRLRSADAAQRSGPRGADVTEDVRPGELAHDYVVRVALRKGAFAWNVLQQRRQPLRPVLTADTTVVLDRRNPRQAGRCRPKRAQMLERLSGRTHQVLTTVAVHFTTWPST